MALSQRSTLHIWVAETAAAVERQAYLQVLSEEFGQHQGALDTRRVDQALLLQEGQSSRDL